MPLERSKIKKILVISLSNIGDVILTFPVIDILLRDFPEAEISVVIGPKTPSLFEKNPHIKHMYIYIKKHTLVWIFKWLRVLRKEKFDLVVDLRHTMLPLLLMIPHRTSLIRKKVGDIHMKDKHLNVLKAVHPFTKESDVKYCFNIDEQDDHYVVQLLSKSVVGEKPFVVIAPGAADKNKCWDAKHFTHVVDYLNLDKQFGVIFIGDEHDGKIVENIQKDMKGQSVDLCGKLTLSQLGIVISRCQGMVSNDSGPMHIASYLNKPIITIYGPTDPKKYGPWSNKCFAVRSNKECDACLNPKQKMPHRCMDNVDVNEVVGAIERTLL